MNRRKFLTFMGDNGKDPFSLLDAARRQDSKDESSLIENRKSTSQALVGVIHTWRNVL